MASTTSFPSLVSVDWLASHMNDSDLVLLDASWYLPTMKRDAKAEFLQDRLPRSRFFSIDEVCDAETSLPHMMPTEKEFAAVADALNITPSSTVIVYDRAGIFSAPRVWFTFRSFGHDRVAVLEGGYPAWIASHHALDRTVLPASQTFDPVMAALTSVRQNPSTPTSYPARLESHRIRSLADMLDNVKTRREQVADARPAGRFVGTEPEPRAGMRGGHMPGSVSVPFGSLLRADKQAMLPPSEIRRVFETAGIQLQEPIVLSCGSGLTACVLALGLDQVGASRVAVYDGSWSEWGSLPNTPIENQLGITP